MNGGIEVHLVDLLGSECQETLQSNTRGPCGAKFEASQEKSPNTAPQKISSCKISPRHTPLLISKGKLSKTQTATRSGPIATGFA